MSLRTPPAASPEEAIADLQRHLDELLKDHDKLRVLDAGCGPRSNLSYPPGTWVVGVDQDETGLARNETVSEPIAADLESWEPEPSSFGLAVSWYVLEHVDRPERALAKLARAVEPGGLVVLAIPNLRSPKSLVAKFTPHAFHVWWRRKVLGRPLAGTPGHGPHPTTLRWTIAPGRFLRQARELGLEPLLVTTFEDGKQRQVRERIGVRGPLWTAVRGVVKVVSLGLLDARQTELLLLFRRRR